MEKIELQEIIDACEEAGSEYLKLYRPLLGYEDAVEFNRGIDDSLEETLNEIEARVGIEFPADFLQMYLLSNGGKYFDLTLYHLSNDKEDKDGLYYKNVKSDIRENYNIPADMLIIGESDDDEYILVGIDEEGYYFYCTWDKQARSIDVKYDYLVEVLAYEIDYYTEAFSVEYDESENEEE